MAARFPVHRFQVSLTDGRILEAAVAGPEDGAVLVFHHGTPGSLIPFEPFVEAATSRGLRHLSYSRPGYGSSGRQRGRRVADCSADTGRIMDILGVDRFFAVGQSGGGPHALACAALMPRRVIAAASIAGIAPWGAKGLDYLAGMGAENIEEFGAALAGVDKLQAYLDQEGPELAQVTGDRIIAALGNLVGDADKGVLTGEFGAFLADNIREALRNGYWGWFDDDMAFIRDWGFNLARIDVPVTIWQGAKDQMVPFAHGRWLAENLPGAHAQLLADHGHLSLAVGLFGRILDDLMASEKT